MVDNNNVTRADLAEALYKEVGLSASDCSKLVDQVLEQISLSLLKGQEVKISSFGAFSVKSKKKRIGRNPKTGVEAEITPRKILSFHPSHILRDEIN
ncbi:MAG: integration host factor subunit alpha [Alphaproteobacteria bacterium]|nr:integration host factor subunit alpha [Alphaproteobacteria bacterium]